MYIVGKNFKVLKMSFVHLNALIKHHNELAISSKNIKSHS
ncbi:hypothetical protein MY1_0531 [Nitrosarchaeum koreense MY1]|uniref:Uncharacterized protein n=1 Tax=Nitrosarchaeum koreense MY1 TaxID=1001994 RepID=F9CVJ5_9ARCH|nr:hypothetical protein MY1_0531 [Nitrosarchaeum koreense MY1]